MRVKTKASEFKAKEQQDNASYFSLLYKTHGAHSAWEFYSRLDYDSKESLRNYRSENGLVDFVSFLNGVQNSRPCGVAYKVGKLKLLEEINQELSMISKRERKSYLNGNLLSLEI